MDPQAAIAVLILVNIAALGAVAWVWDRQRRIVAALEASIATVHDQATQTERVLREGTASTLADLQSRVDEFTAQLVAGAVKADEALVDVETRMRAALAKAEEFFRAEAERYVRSTRTPGMLLRAHALGAERRFSPDGSNGSPGAKP